jgi:hypothetical protein
MAAMTDYLRNKIRRQIFRGEAFVFPTTIYLSLHTAVVAADGSGAEASGGSYARHGVVCNTGNWTVDGANAGRIYNTNSETWSPVATAGWGTIGWGAMWDALTVGNMLFYGPLDAAVTILTGQTFSYAPGEVAMIFT